MGLRKRGLKKDKKNRWKAEIDFVSPFASKNTFHPEIVSRSDWSVYTSNRGKKLRE